MAEVTATMRTLDLSNAETTPVRGQHVWKLQAMLNVWLQSADEEPPPDLLITDGLAGGLTRKAVLHFQGAYELADDAVVGPITWRVLFESDRIAP